MKRLFTLLLLFLPYISFSQAWILPIDSTSGKVVFKEVVEVQNPKLTLFKNAQKWYSKKPIDSELSLLKESVETGIIVLSGKYDYPQSEGNTHEYLEYLMTIDCKDNKYRILVTDMFRKINIGSRTLNVKISNENLSSKAQGIDRNGNRVQLSENQISINRSKNEYIALEMNLILSSLRIEMSAKDDF